MTHSAVCIECGMTLDLDSGDSAEHSAFHDEMDAMLLAQGIEPDPASAFTITITSHGE